MLYCYIISSTFLYIALAVLVMIYTRLKHIRIWTILDILAVFAIFNSLCHGLPMNSFCLISIYHFDNTFATTGMFKL